MFRNIRSLLILFAVLFAVAACSSLNQVTPSELDDEAMEADIRASIAKVVPSQTFDIGVSVDDGAVTLTGTVDSTTERQKIVNAAADVEGVRRIINNIQVR